MCNFQMDEKKDVNIQHATQLLKKNDNCIIFWEMVNQFSSWDGSKNHL